MKADLLDILCCPLCRQKLTLRAEKTEGAEILTGTLTCTGCGETFPIEDGIPDLLPPEDRD